MRSLLTRRVFRQLTLGALHADLPYSQWSELQCTRQWRTAAVNAALTPQRRALFGFSRKKKTRLPRSRLKAGFQIMELCKERISRNERPPPSDELAEAFVEFFATQSKSNGGTYALEDTQVAAAIATFEHLRRSSKQGGDFGVSDEDLRTALTTLRSGSTTNHVQMATLLFDELIARRLRKIQKGSKTSPLHADLIPYIFVLCQNGSALQARGLVESFWESDLKDARTTNGGKEEKAPSQWSTVLRGLIRERKNSEVDETVRLLQKLNVAFDNKLHQAIVTFYAHYMEDMEMTKRWYYHTIADAERPTTYTGAAVLKLCIKKGEFEWGQAIFDKLLERNPDNRRSWSIILQWCAANGRGVDEIEEIMKTMSRRNKEKADLQPGMDLINGLIEYANSKNDPYTAERYYALGQKWGFTPDARTHLLQLDYRIEVKDLSGALDAYNKLQIETPPVSEDIPYINRLIVVLCLQARERHEAIMSLVEELRQRKGAFFPQTVAALALVHIQRREVDDYADLMKNFVHNFSLGERSAIRDTLMVAIFEEKVDPGLAWETYDVLQETMRETLDLDLRVKIMREFFRRERGDMALHVFGHMRKDKDKALRPSLDLYCECLEGLSKCGDRASVQLVHNMMNMDEDIEPNTRALNAVMLGYVGVGNFGRVRMIWEDILFSREGPSHSSIKIALHACEGLGPVAETWTNEIWNLLKEKNIEVTREIFAAYVGAIAGTAKRDLTWKILEDAEEVCGSKVDALM